MKKVLSMILVIILVVMINATASEMGGIYLENKDRFIGIVQKLYEGGATDEDMIVFFEDVEAEVLENCTSLNEENFDTVMQTAILNALKYSRNLRVYNALVSKFSEEAMYFVLHEEIPASLRPLYTEMKSSIFSSEELMFKIESTFIDQREFSWAMDAIETLVQNGIIKGYPGKTFKGNRNITRAEFTKMVIMAFVGNDTSQTTDFIDVLPGDWYYSYIATARNNSIISGYDGNIFKPNDNITRQDMALIIKNTKFAAEVGGKAVNFTDAAEISDYAAGAVATLCEKGIINGMGDGTFAPKSFATRAQAAQMIYNAMSVQ